MPTFNPGDHWQIRFGDDLFLSTLYISISVDDLKVLILFYNQRMILLSTIGLQNP